MGLLDEIKKRLSITGDYQNELLLGLIDDVKQYLLSAGVEQSVVNSVKSVGCISRGVLDLWTKDSFSDLFVQRAIQLTFEPETELEPIPEVEPEVTPDPDVTPDDVPDVTPEGTPDVEPDDIPEGDDENVLPDDSGA